VLSQRGNQATDEAANRMLQKTYEISGISYSKHHAPHATFARISTRRK